MRDSFWDSLRDSFWESFGGSFSYYDLTPQIEAEMTRTNGQITALKDAILAPEPTDVSVSVSATNNLTVQTMLRKHDNRLYLFTCEGDSTYDPNNRGNGTATFMVIGTTSDLDITVYDENRTLSLSGNQFSDNFQQLEVHIYEIDLP